MWTTTTTTIDDASIHRPACALSTTTTGMGDVLCVRGGGRWSAPTCARERGAWRVASSMEALEESIDAVVRGLCRAHVASAASEASVAVTTGDGDDDDDGIISVEHNMNNAAVMLDDYARETAALDDELDALCRALDAGAYVAGRWRRDGGDARGDGKARGAGGRDFERVKMPPPPPEMPELWNARFVTDVVGGNTARGDESDDGSDTPDFDAVDGGDEYEKIKNDDDDDDDDTKGFKTVSREPSRPEPSRVGLFAASIPVVSARVMHSKGGQTMSERVEDIVTRVDVARAFIAEAREAMKHRSAVACMTAESAKMTAAAARAKLKSRRRSNI